MEAAYDLDPDNLRVHEHLLEWDYDTWAPRLDAAAHAAQLAREKEEERLRRVAEAEIKGRILKEHVERQIVRRTLERWYLTWESHFAATMIERIARGRAARKLARRKQAESEVLTLRTKGVVKKINAHLLRHVIKSWYRYWSTMASKRRGKVRPLSQRISRNMLRDHFIAWRHRARRQVVGRMSAKRAMIGLHKWSKKGRKKVLVSNTDELPKFYSNSLNSLANFPLVKEVHESSVKYIVEEKLRTTQLLEEHRLKAEIGAEEARRLEAVENEEEAERAGGAAETEPEINDGSALADFNKTLLSTTTGRPPSANTSRRKHKVQIAPEPLS
jgi:hypothetical protein